MNPTVATLLMLGSLQPKKPPPQPTSKKDKQEEVMQKHQTISPKKQKHSKNANPCGRPPGKNY